MGFRSVCFLVNSNIEDEADNVEGPWAMGGILARLHDWHHSLPYPAVLPAVGRDVISANLNEGMRRRKARVRAACFDVGRRARPFITNNALGK
jgi:hypothetical protein